MWRFIRFVLLSASFLFLLQTPLDGVARDIRIHIAVTSDVHARLFPYDFMNDSPRPTSLASVYYLIENARARQSSIILLDNGDMLQGTPAAYYANFVQDHKQNLFSRVMNLMRYDAATIGNHDIEAGPEVYNRLKNEFRFPWLGANVIDTSTGKPYFEPYTIIRRQGVDIAILGLTTPSVPTWLPPHLWEGLYFQDMVEAARYWVDHIRETENPHAIIGLFHSGKGAADAPQEAHPLEHASAYIARHVPGFDVIFTGHDHRKNVDMITNVAGKQVLIVSPGHFAEDIAVAELIFNRPQRRVFELKEKRAELVPTHNVAPSQSFFREFEKDMAAILAFSRENIVRLSHDINTREALFGPSAIANLVHQYQLKVSDADISFTAPLAFDDVIRSGMLQRRDFFRMYEYENYLYTMELSGQEILDYLEYSYGLWLNEMRDSGDHLLRFRLDDQGNVMQARTQFLMLANPFYNFDSAAGIRYSVDVSKPVGSRVSIYSFEDGRDFDLDRVYRVAINSYRGSGGGGHLTRGAGIPHAELSKRIVFTSERNIRSGMVAYFSDIDVINPEVPDNWEVLPADWRLKGMEKDTKILFPSR